MNASKTFLAALLLSAAFGLGACDTAEERAEGHYQSAIELIEAGDVDRGLVELRNVFDLNGQHKEARLLYARLLRERGEIRDAFGQYLLSAEQYPDVLESRRALTEMAIDTSNWDEAERHGKMALELAPEDANIVALNAILAYRTAVEDEDDLARAQAVEQIETVLDQMDDPNIGRRILIDNHVRDQRLGAALEELDRAIAANVDDERLYRQRLAVLSRLGDEDEIRNQLEKMVVQFPDSTQFQQALIQWYQRQGDVDAAETFLRTRAELPDADIGVKISFVVFVQNQRGPDAARTELLKFIAEGGDTRLFESLIASLDYEAGDTDTAIATMERLIADAEPSDERTTLQVSLARMLVGVGNQVGARQVVEEILANDPTQVEALKLRANWLIEDDRADDAIVTLRTALDQAPQDPELMAQMARAHLRNGSRGLAGELLSLAAEASNNAPRYALLYARFLLENDNTNTATSILVDSLRMAPGNIQVLNELARIYISEEDWPRAEQIEATLRRMSSDEAIVTADALTVDRLRGQQRGDEAIRLLEQLTQSSPAAGSAEVAIVRSYMAARDFDRAESYISSRLEADPDRRVMRLLQAAVFGATDRVEQAIEVYEDLVEQEPRDEIAWRSLYQVKYGDGDVDGAGDVLNRALAVLPDAPNLLWAQASQLERAGDIDGSIAIYERLYEQNSGSIVVANNLASLISAYRTSDAAEVERAFVIARRLRGSEVPAFQDTYGWIALQRGEVIEALEHLEPAAAGLPDDPLVQYHLAVAYERAGQTEEALAQFRRAVDLAGPADSREQFDIARAEIQRLEEIVAAQ